MKKKAEPLDDLILSMYPINNLIEGWYFRYFEVSNCVYRIEGTDKWGHSVSRTCSEPELKETLNLCVNDAQEIQKHLKEKGIE